MQLIRAVNDNGALARSGYMRAAGVEKIGQIGDLGLACGVGYHCCTAGSGGGYHDILCSADAGDGQGDIGSVQPLGCAAVQLAVVLAYNDAHLPEGVKMQVDRSRAQLTAARESHARLPEARYHSAQKDDRRAHTVHELRRDVIPGDAAGIDNQGIPLAPRRTAYVTQDSQRRLYVAQPRTVVQHTFAAAQERSRQYGQGAVL